MLEQLYKKMNMVNTFFDYTKISKVPKIKGTVHTLFSLIANYCYKKEIKKRKSKSINEFGFISSSREKKIIVSLTTFPKRIDTVWITIDTLLNQTLKPDLIILWLASSEFKEGLNSLPKVLTDMIDRGLIIKFCENIKPHKKYYYSMQEYPNDIVITVDDDVLYPPGIVEELFSLYKKFPKNICCTRGHLITVDAENNINLYSGWIKNPSTDEAPSRYICPTGVGGVLYPPNSLIKEVFNKESIMNLCLNADDLWLKSMSLMNGTDVVKSSMYNYDFFSVSKTRNSALSKTNVMLNENDKQLSAILSEYDVKI